MEKCIPLSETNTGKMHACNKEACTGCRHKKEIVQQPVDKHADEKNATILQSHYAALLQYYSFPVRSGNQDGGYLQCT